jgi:CheY-like chemotaxis protein
MLPSHFFKGSLGKGYMVGEEVKQREGTTFQSEMPASRRILLVENDPNDVKLTLMALGKCNLVQKVDVVHDGCEALDYLFIRGAHSERNKGNPLFLILDLKMPKVSGIDVLRKIRSTQHLKMIPVIILSSSKQDQDLKDCYLSGSNAYVVKPVDFQIFEKVIIEIGQFWTHVNEPPPTVS